VDLRCFFYRFIGAGKLFFGFFYRFIGAGKLFFFFFYRFIGAGKIFFGFSIASSVKKILPIKIVSLYSTFFSKMCDGIALINTFLSIAAHHCRYIMAQKNFQLPWPLVTCAARF
jgi:hypothetical protein